MIVYIDDEALLCRVFARFMEEIGVAARAFTEPQEAIAYVNAHTCAMVICDYRMPGMSGLALLERLDTTAPFVVVTGDPGAVAALRAHPRVAGYLVKPFSPEELLAKIEAVVKIR